MAPTYTSHRPRPSLLPLPCSAWVHMEADEMFIYICTCTAQVHMEADEVFAKVDTNGDGLLSLEELSAYLAGGLTGIHIYMHTSVRDQYLSLEELHTCLAGGTLR